MTTPADRGEEVVFPREAHRGDHVGHPPTPCDERGLARDLTVPDRARLGVAGVATLDDVSEHARSELFGGGDIECSCHGGPLRRYDSANRRRNSSRRASSTSAIAS